MGESQWELCLKEAWRELTGTGKGKWMTTFACLLVQCPAKATLYFRKLFMGLNTCKDKAEYRNVLLLSRMP